MSDEAFAKIEAGQKLLTFAPLLAILRAGTLERSFATATGQTAAHRRDGRVRRRRTRVTERQVAVVHLE